MPERVVSGNFVHSAEYMRLTLNPGGGSGGTCFGDSGGPDRLGGDPDGAGSQLVRDKRELLGRGYSAGAMCRKRSTGSSASCRNVSHSLQDGNNDTSGIRQVPEVSLLSSPIR